jgi:WG repeat protein
MRIRNVTGFVALALSVPMLAQTLHPTVKSAEKIVRFCALVPPQVNVSSKDAEARYGVSNPAVPSNSGDALFVAAVGGLHAKCGYIDHEGNLAIALQFDRCGEFFEGLALVLVGEKWGFIDASGKFAIEPRLEWERRAIQESKSKSHIMSVAPSAFHDGLASAWLGGKWGYLDKTGATVIAPRFDEAFEFSESLATVRVGKGFGYIDKKGAMAFPGEFQDARAFSDGLAAVKAGDKWGYIDKTGNMVISPRFGETKRTLAVLGYPQIDTVLYDFSNFGEGLAGVKIGRKWGYIDKQGKTAIAPQFDSAREPFSEGLAVVGIGDLEGFVDASGKIAIKPKFQTAHSFREGLAAVKLLAGFKEGQWGYINKQGEMAISARFVDAGTFHHGLARVTIRDGKFLFNGYVDTSGKLIWREYPK